jgi:predicted acetyltransferase
MTASDRGSLEFRRAADEDWPAIADLRELAFRFRGTRERLLPGMWVVTEREAVIGCARLQVEAQWFGGRAEPTGMVSSVAVAPEARGRGVSRAILRGLLEQARADECVGVSLYPSALQPYRRAGFAVAGSHLTARLHLASIRADPSAKVEQLDGDLAGLMSQYGRWSATTDGAVDRSEAWWRERVLSSDPPTPHGVGDGSARAYVVRDAGSVIGHVVFTQRALGDEAYLAGVVCRSLAWDVPEAARALLWFLASGLPLTTAVTWPASLVDPLGAFTDDQPEIVAAHPWMHRLVDPVAAIRGRAYAHTTRAAVAFHVDDAFMPEWAATLSVTIEGGTAHVEEITGPAAPIRPDVLAAILVGGLHPLDAVRLGWLPDDPALVAGMRALAPTGRRWIGDSF